MHFKAGYSIALAVVLCSAASGVWVWTEDFEAAAVGATSGNNENMAGTVVQTANTASGMIVDLEDPANAAVKSAFTHGSGRVLLLSVGDNDFAALRSSLDPVPFAAVADTNELSLSYDMYIPTALDVPIGRINPRLEALGEPGNGPTFGEHEESAVGSYHVTYSGTVAGWLNGAGPADSARPFIFVEQKQGGGDNGATADVVYIDNIQFQIGEGPGNPLPVPGWDFEDLKSGKVASTPLVKWQHFGPGMSGYIDKFWINNGDPNAMYDELDMGNGHVTLNRGEFWTSFKELDGNGLPGGITGIEFSYQDPDFGLMMAKEGIYQSTDRGRTWDFVVDIDSSNSQMHSVLTVDPNDDDIWYIGAGQHWMIKSTHWTKDGLHYSSDGNYSAGFVLKSTNRGQSWTKVDFPVGDEDFSAIIVDPRNSSVVYATCQYGLYKSTNGGTSWVLLSGGGLPAQPPRDLGCFYDGANEFYLYYLAVTHYETAGSEVLTSGGVFRSGDDGATWEDLTGDLGIDFTQITAFNNTAWDYHQRYYRAVSWYLKMDYGTFKSSYNLPTQTFSQFTRIAVDPTNKDRIYLSHNYKHDYAFPPGNIWMTENGGTNWFAAAREGTYWGNETDKAYWQSRAVQPLGINTKMAHVDREHNEEDNITSGPRFVFCNQLGEVYTAFAQQIMRSTDHGASWVQMDDDETAEGSGHWVGRGNSNLPGETFHLDARTPGNYLFGSGEHGLWMNTNDGDMVYPGAIAVKQLTGQSHADWDWTSISTIAVHPNDTNTIYTLQFRQNKRGELWRSQDRGQSWAKVSKVLDFPGSNDVIDQRSHLIDYLNPDTMYFCVPWSEWERWSRDSVNNGRKVTGEPAFFGQGIYKSTDGGVSWSMITNGIPAARSVYRLAMDPVDPEILYAALNETHQGDPGGLYRTLDGGASWSAMSLPAGVVAVNHVQVHKTTGDLYIACGEYDTGRDVGGGFVSRDDGATWEKLFDMPYLRHFSASEADPDVIVANVHLGKNVSSRNPGAYVSIDGGVNWFKINRSHGQPDGIRKIEADPTNPDVLWMSLHGTGFFRADISGLRTGKPAPLFWDWMDSNGQASRLVDADGDGLDSTEEYVAGTDPADAMDYPYVMIAADLIQGATVGLPTKLDRFYTVESSTNLVAGWSTLTNGLEGTGEIIEVIDPRGPGQKFYRMKVGLE